MNKNFFRKEICSYCKNRCSKRTTLKKVKYRIKYIKGKKTKILKCPFYSKLSK